VAYKAVADALMELNDCNPSARYVIPELWSLNDGRKASLQEAIKCIIIELKTYKSLSGKANRATVGIQTRWVNNSQSSQFCRAYAII